MHARSESMTAALPVFVTYQRLGREARDRPGAHPCSRNPTMKRWSFDVRRGVTKPGLLETNPVGVLGLKLYAKGAPVEGSVAPPLAQVAA